MTKTITLKFKDKLYSLMLKGMKLKFQRIKLPTQSTVGITNRTTDGYYILFIDYDMTFKEVVFEDIDFYQKNYGLGTAIILSSSEVLDGGGTTGNYHVIFFEKLTFPEVQELLKLARCDVGFRSGWKWHNRRWVLRVNSKQSLKNGSTTKEKPRHIATIPHVSTRISSTAHINFYNKLLGIKIRIPRNSDNSKPTDVELIQYGCSK